MSKISFNHRTGGFDEVIAENASIHLERMSQKHIWMVVGTEEGSVTIDLKTTMFGAIKASIVNDGFEKNGQPSSFVNYQDANSDPLQALWDAVDPPPPPRPKIEEEFYIRVSMAFSFLLFGAAASAIWAFINGIEMIGLMYALSIPFGFLIATAIVGYYTYCVIKKDDSSV